ncbi:hybrid sensor histidine kinase/response regulator [Paraburkholderia caballeronis]|uniref:hybrid sensor histidine kinase/response regulator n=1 Tax=Paraburkholderia caballeronis TaxID=416943 RepID=UPI001064CC2A|nr:hybrid sensor histidine kinase/response regulator [Paraburkholderia caballeronis]TDV19720.1 two-component system chemotaxis sensor kinase CheA/two-component system sensor histidine kinase and response regulator WspE [Paraburkholderia caballeronis]TDV22319.1 two-component system chemotaxis sensor kinase CheA/two-component system sensor histidine kinase and response regulator WspE [Paraburkholderia caballeronis]TDV29223.1 two-component system chemotaxis sensor kinase CheA/two-component system s
MSFDPEFLRLLQETFQAELAEQLQHITDGLLSLEKLADGNERQEALNSVFRCAHNIKGAARSVDATGIADLAHQLESLFSALRAGRPVEPGLIDLSLQCVDALRELADAGLSGAAPPALLLRLGEAVANGAPVAEGASRAGGDGMTAAAVDETAFGLPPAATPSPPSPISPTAPTAHTSMPDAATPRPVAMPAGGSEATPDSAQASPPPRERAAPSGGVDHGDIVRVPSSRLQHISALAEDLQLAKIAMGEHFQEVQRLERGLGRLEAQLRRWGDARHATAHAQAVADAGTRRVAGETLPKLVQLRRETATLGKAMRATVNRTNHLSSALQGTIRVLQMVPVANLLRPMARMVRDIGRELGKEAELHVSGDQIEVDRPVLDGLRDPLMHLLRNAIDHGLEPPDARRAAAKEETGHIWIDVATAGSQVVLRIRDDGRGIDAGQVGAIALRKQLIQADELERLDDDARLALIFRPGFSSKDTVTDLSGRGVGLDVVMANLRKLKGSVRLDTVPGRGTTFTLELPLTLSTDRGLHVRVGGEHLLIPSITVDRVVEIGRAEVIEVAGSQALMLAGQPVPLRDLAATLRLPAREQAAADARLQVVVVSKGWARVAFVVDDVLGEREIVIKRLPPPLHSVPNIGGATLNGNGEIMMVLQADDLVENALRLGGETLAPHQEAAGAEAPRVRHILVCDDSITTRTLQKNLLESKGYRVTLATDGQMGWELLQDGDFDIVITDIEMPRLTGFELTGRIRHSERHGELPVIVVSSLAREEDRLRGIEAGADAYIVKGEFESQALLDALHQLI